jgi:hypothetical protein
LTQFPLSAKWQLRAPSKRSGLRTTRARRLVPTANIEGLEAWLQRACLRRCIRLHRCIRLDRRQRCIAAAAASSQLHPSYGRSVCVQARPWPRPNTRTQARMRALLHACINACMLAPMNACMRALACASTCVLLRESNLLHAISQQCIAACCGSHVACSLMRGACCILHGPAARSRQAGRL